jgi:hypothetical protein
LYQINDRVKNEVDEIVKKALSIYEGGQSE